jgi:hypothetical protein
MIVIKILFLLGGNVSSRNNDIERSGHDIVDEN